MGLTERARTVLGVLAEADRDLCVAEIAWHAELDHRRVSEILMAFWRDGWVTRRQSQGEDGRRRCYPITDAGQEQWMQIQPQGALR